jgi:hypothetical protein
MADTLKKPINRAERLADAVIEELRGAGDDVFKKALIETMEFVSAMKALEVRMQEVFLAGVEQKDPIILLAAINQARSDIRQIPMFEDIVSKPNYNCKLTKLLDHLTDGKLQSQYDNVMHIMDTSKRVRANLLSVAEEHISAAENSDNLKSEVKRNNGVQNAPKPL